MAKKTNKKQLERAYDSFSNAIYNHSAAVGADEKSDGAIRLRNNIKNVSDLLDAGVTKSAMEIAEMIKPLIVRYSDILDKETKNG